MRSTTKLTKREKFNLRLDTIPPNTVVKVLIFTDDKGEIAGWNIGTFETVEGMHEYIDVTERQKIA